MVVVVGKEPAIFFFPFLIQEPFADAKRFQERAPQASRLTTHTHTQPKKKNSNSTAANFRRQRTGGELPAYPSLSALLSDRSGRVVHSCGLRSCSLRGMHPVPWRHGKATPQLLQSQYPTWWWTDDDSAATCQVPTAMPSKHYHSNLTLLNRTRSGYLS